MPMTMADRLRTFFDLTGGALRAQPKELQIARLRAFFLEGGGRLQNTATPERKPKVQVDQEGLRNALGDLHTPLATARMIADRLRTFFVLAGGALRAHRKELQIARLRAFFLEADGRFRTISRPERKQEVQIDKERLRKALEKLRAPLAKARAEGAFLNVWLVAGLKRWEVRNAAVLGALFDPRLCGDQAIEFLDAFLDRLRRRGIRGLPVNTALKCVPPYSIAAETWPLGNDDSRIDLAIEGAQFIIVIELKIDAREGIDQIEKYMNILRARASLTGKDLSFIYLSPRAPLSHHADVAHATWADIVSAARRVVRVRRTSGKLSVHDFWNNLNPMSPVSAEDPQAMSDARLPESDLDTLLIKNIGDLDAAVRRIRYQIEPQVFKAVNNEIEDFLSREGWRGNPNWDDGAWLAPDDWKVNTDDATSSEDYRSWFELSGGLGDEFEESESEDVFSLTRLLGVGNGSLGLRWKQHAFKKSLWRRLVTSQIRLIETLKVSGFNYEDTQGSFYFKFRLDQTELAQAIEDGVPENAMEPLRKALKTLLDTKSDFDKLLRAADTVDHG
jgi:hypothetical protein